MAQPAQSIQLEERAAQLNELIADADEDLVRTYREQLAEARGERRSIGWARDILPELPESFFEPLPPDVLDIFEGRAA